MHKRIIEVLKGAGIVLSCVMIITGCSSSDVGKTSLLDNEKADVASTGMEGTSPVTLSSTDSGGSSLGKAVVSFSAKFSEKGEVTKSRIDDTTTLISIDVYGDCVPNSTEWYNQGHIELSPETPSVTVELSPGECHFKAFGQDALTRDIDFTHTAGTLISGANSVILTFLRGKWTFVGEDGTTATPVVLNGGGSLGGFLMTPSDSISYARKSSIDPNTPYGENGYYWLDWFYDDGTLFATNSDINQVSQFTGGTSADSNESIINGGGYNLTQDTGWVDTLTAGDRVIFILGDEPGILNDDIMDPDLTPYLTSKVANGTTLTGNIFEATFVSSTSVATDPPTGFCVSSASVSNARAAALKKALSNPAKASTSLGNFTTTWKDCVWNELSMLSVETDVTESYSDVYIHPFTAKGSQLPSSGSSGQILVQ